MPGGDDDTPEAPEISSAAVAGMRQDLWSDVAKRSPQSLQSLNLTIAEPLDFSNGISRDDPWDNYTT